jgi:hypothetical protein
VDVRPVDPRIEDSTVNDPVYWVVFWARQASHGGAEPGYRSDEYDVRGASSVHEVLAWAEANAGRGRSFVVYVFDEQQRRTIRLAGTDPFDSSQHLA